jgi:hypothetical protein
MEGVCYAPYQRVKIWHIFGRYLSGFNIISTWMSFYKAKAIYILIMRTKNIKKNKWHRPK